jgi:hypothetical protein
MVFYLMTVLEIDERYLLVTCLYAVEVHQGDSGVSQLPEIGPVHDSEQTTLSAISTLWSSSPVVREGSTRSSYAMEDARDSWAPLAVAVLGRSWSDLKSRRPMVRGSLRHKGASLP